MDKSTGKELIVNGNKVTATKTFTATQANGSIEIEFTFDSSALAGKSVVAFETLKYNGKEIAAHKDINDREQTVSFKKPSIGTTAKDKASNNNKDVAPSKTTTIVDTVSYTDLIVGKEYTISGVLMDKSTGKELIVNGNKVTATKTFTATQANGSIDIEFTFDSSVLAGKSVVAFETLKYNGKEIAAHKDINDSKQTVSFKISEGDGDFGGGDGNSSDSSSSTTITGNVATGDSFAVVSVLFGIIAIAVITIMVAKKKRTTY